MVVLAACVLAPVVDLFEQWDRGDADLEGTVLVIMLCVGAGVVVGVAAVPGRSGPRLCSRRVVEPAASRAALANPRVGTLLLVGSPPVPLRV